MDLEIVTRKPDTDARATSILFVHGAWHGAWCWQEHFMPYFVERGYTSHALSLRGHGGSQRPARFRLARIADYVDDLTQVVEQLPEPPVLVGHSMGGLVVQKYLEAHTAPGAVLLASVPVKGVLRTTLRIAVRHPLAFIKANLTWSLYPIIGKPALCREAFFSADISDEDLWAHFGRMQDESYLAFLDMMLFNLPKPERVKTDLLILGAKDDTIFYPDEIEATAKAYQTRHVMFADMAHDMMLDRNWESVADRVLGWLEEKGF
jgi:alpha-beta hydrolase superfamily lysophospholipase